jgi:hypothetical protein
MKRLGDWVNWFAVCGALVGALLGLVLAATAILMWGGRK